MSRGALADLEWRGSELVRLTAVDRARGLALLFSHLENALEVTDMNSAESISSGTISPSTWHALRELTRAYQLLGKGFQVAADRRGTLDQMTASRLGELMVAVSGAETRFVGALASERQQWLDEFVTGRP